MPRHKGPDVDEELLRFSQLSVTLARLGQREEVEKLRATIARRAGEVRSPRVREELLVYEAEELLHLGWPAAARELLERAWLDDAKAKTLLAEACVECGDREAATLHARVAITAKANDDEWRVRAIAVTAAVHEDREEARKILEGLIASTVEDERDARIDIDLGVIDLLDARPTSAARLRTGRVLADARGDQAVSVLARFAIASEEALHGDLVAARSCLDDATRRGAGLSFAAPIAWIVQTIVEAQRADMLLASGARARATRVWTDTVKMLAEIERSEPTVSRPRFCRFLELARGVLHARDPNCSWVVGPRSMWIESPDSTRVDLTRFPLLRTIFTTLFRRQASDRPVVTTDELCADAWPAVEPTATPVLRNRMKAALSKMRQLGLRDAIRRVPTGQRLAPEARFVPYRPSLRTETEDS